MDLLQSSKRFIGSNFHALTHKNFRYYWFGQCISLIGTWAQNIGQSWLVLSLTGSPFLLGLLGTFQFLPITVFSLFAGVLVDRFPKKKIIIITQSISMVLAFILSALVFTGTVKFWHILLLAFILGCSNTIDMPARQSFTVEIAGRKDLMNAIALNSATFNLARIVGPAIGAMLMSYMGPAWCFFVNGLSYIAVIYGLFHIEEGPFIKEEKSRVGIFIEIKDGLRYIMRNPLLLETLLLVTIVGIFIFNFNVLVPVFTKNVLHMQEKTYGLLLSSIGVGSLTGALFVSMRSKKGPKRRLLIASSIITSIMLILTGLTRIFYLTAVCLAITGIFNIFFSTTANSTLQINSKDEYRGRVMSIYSLVFAGSAPIGNLFTGTVSDKLGASMGFILSGLLTLILVAVLSIIFKINLKKVEEDTKM